MTTPQPRGGAPREGAPREGEPKEGEPKEGAPKEGAPHQSGRYPFSVCLSSYPDRERSTKASLDYQKKGLTPSSWRCD